MGTVTVPNKAMQIIGEHPSLVGAQVTKVGGNTTITASVENLRNVGFYLRTLARAVMNGTANVPAHGYKAAQLERLGKRFGA